MSSSPSIEDDFKSYIIDVYRERAYLIAFLSTCYPSTLQPATDPMPGFERVVVIETPTGQMAWHIADNDLFMFNHLERIETNSWDGHSTYTKYDRLLRLKALNRTKMREVQLLASNPPTTKP